MARERKRTAKDVGSDSPPSESAKEQQIAGHAGGPQGEQPAGSGRQPPQTSNRRSARHEQLPEERKSFSADEDLSKQGEGRNADSIRKSSATQGLAGRSHSAGTSPDNAEESAQAGEPSVSHTRHGRQKVPGNRDPNT